MAGGDGYVIDADGWTIRTADGSIAAHAEHTVAITRGRPAGADGPRLTTSQRPTGTAPLTQPPRRPRIARLDDQSRTSDRLGRCARVARPAIGVATIAGCS